MSKFIYRIVIDRWPTDNGAPFTEQTSEYWEKLVERHLDPAWPHHSWVPDLEPWLYDVDSFGSIQHPEGQGAMILDTNGQPLLNVPALYRRQFFARHAAASRLKQLEIWGVQAQIQRAPIGDWE